MRRKFEDRIADILRPLLERAAKGRPFKIDNVPLSEEVARQWDGLWDMGKVYAVALNMGNGGNLKALMRGYGWTDADLQNITSRLSSEEWQAIQKIWDTIDELYPLINAAHEKLKGAPLRKVAAQPLRVLTAEGTLLDVRGGYYPLKFDQRLSAKAAEQQSVDAMLNDMEGVLRRPNPKDGMTKTRQGGTLPPELSLGVLQRHILESCHYATHALPLRDTAKLFANREFKEAFVRHAGLENHNLLLPWLRRIARPQGEHLNMAEKAFDWLSKRGVTYAMGLNMRSAFLQFTSIGNSWNEVGFGNWLKGAGLMLRNPQEMWRTVREKSAYMQHRAMLMDDTVFRICEEMRAQGVSGIRHGAITHRLDMVRQGGMALIGACDAAVAYPTWLAAYNRAIADGALEEDAVAAADGAVVAAQGGGGPMDTPEALRSNMWLRVICPFMSFAAADFNRKMEHVRGFAEYVRTGNSGMTPGRFFRHFALEWVTPVVVTTLVLSGGRDGEPPEPEEFAWEALGFLTMGLPVVRDVARMAEDNFSGSGFKGGRAPLFLTGFQSAWKAAKGWATEDMSDEQAYRAWKHSINALGFFLGVGTPQIFRTWEGGQAYFVDGEGGPLAPLFGKPKKGNGQ